MKTQERTYKNITKKVLKKVDLSYKETVNSISIEKNSKVYKPNKTNKIEFFNRERENADWFVNKFGGKIEFLPTIQEDGGIPCSDYKYFPKKDKNKWFYLEEKETTGKGKNVFYHALEDKHKQANIFLIDCTNSNFNTKEIYERINKIFSSKKTQYVKYVIVKNGNELFGVFQGK